MRLVAFLALVLFVAACDDPLSRQCNDDRTKAMTTIIAMGKCRKTFQDSWTTIMDGKGTLDQKLVPLITAEAARDACEQGAWNASGFAPP